MLLNEPSAAMRVVELNLLTIDGAGLPLSTVFSIGQCKIKKAGGAFANTVNLPQAVASGAAGSFTLQLTVGEVDTPGPLRLQISPTGGQVADLVDVVNTNPVEAAAVASAVFAQIYEGSATFLDLMRDLGAVFTGDAVDLTSSPKFKDSTGAVRVAFTVGGGGTTRTRG